MSLPVWMFAVLLSAGSAVINPEDLDTAFQSLKQAEAQKDAAQVKKLAAEVCALARQVSSAPAPQDSEEKEAWTKRVKYAQDIEVHTEYALAATAFQGAPEVTIDLLSTLEQQNPKSKYLDEAYSRYFLALNQTGASAKIIGVAEKALTHFPENEDLLLVLADNAMTKKQSDRAQTLARRLVASLSKHPKPEGMSAADWERKRSAALGRGNWIAGMVASEKTQYFEADKSLRAALPLIKGNDAMMAPALYFLGVANFQLGKMTMNKAQVLEALKFSEQSAAIAGPYSQHAWHNALVMKTEAAKMR